MVYPVSVQITTFNEEKNIAACLIGVLRNSPQEIIVIDRGSKDHTVEIARKFGAKVLVYPDTSRGFRRLQGFLSTDCKYVACVDADDRIPQDWILRMLGELELGDYSAIQSTPRVPKIESRIDRGWDNYFAESVRPQKDTIMVGRPALYVRESVANPDISVGHYSEDTEFSKYLSDKNLRQGVLPIISHREVPNLWRANFKKWRGYGIGYSDFLQIHKKRRLPIYFHVLIRIPIVRAFRSARNGYPSQFFFNGLMSANIVIGMFQGDINAMRKFLKRVEAKA
jgi:glycosyltransferase involved in cell wall biosynthesis